MKTTKQKAIVFCAGILICLLILEVALRVVGSIYADISESDTGKNKKGTTTILCIGDSFTFGIGAPRDLSYPAQLEKLLNQAAPGVKYSVINRGWPGQSSFSSGLRIISKSSSRILSLSLSELSTWAIISVIRIFYAKPKSRRGVFCRNCMAPLIESVFTSLSVYCFRPRSPTGVVMSLPMSRNRQGY